MSAQVGCGESEFQSAPQTWAPSASLSNFAQNRQIPAFLHPDQAEKLEGQVNFARSRAKIGQKWHFFPFFSTNTLYYFVFSIIICLIYSNALLLSFRTHKIMHARNYRAPCHTQARYRFEGVSINRKITLVILNFK